MNNLTAYPIEVQNAVKSTLRAYSECHIERVGADYRVCTAHSIKTSYADEEILDTFTQDDVFTATEQVENYINSFGCYPVEYTGKRDYKILHKLEEKEFDPSTSTLTHWVGKIDEDGNFVLTHKESFVI